MSARRFRFAKLSRALLSAAALDQGSQEVPAAAFSGRAGYLAKLDFLASTDIFLGHDWVRTRADLLDVYPYHLHMKNFIEVFRRQYRLERGRL